MRVCIVRPPTMTTAEAVGEDACPPLGPAYLASAARHCGHDVTIVDGLGEALDRFTRIPTLATAMRHGLSDEEIVARIPSNAEVIGVSAMFSLEWPFTRELTRKVRERFPDAFLLAGGEHITALPEFSLTDCPAIDACVLGEGEQTFVDVLETLANGGDLHQVGGLCLRDGGGFVRTTARQRVRQLDTLPWPAWDLVPIDSYLDHGIKTGLEFGRSIPMLASRGCPYRCTFCSSPSMWGTLWRSRTPEEVIEEIRDNVQRYRVTNIDFYDLTAIVKREWIVEFCRQLIENGPQITWQLPSGTRSEALDAEVTGLLYRAGCRFVTYAPESGSEEMLVAIKKQIKPARMLESMQRAVNNGMIVKANFIIGFPDETFSQAMQTYRFILKVARAGLHDIACFPFAPYPGSELFAMLAERGEIVIADPYFHSLLHTDPRYNRSYNNHFSNTQVRLLCLFAMGLFYAASFLLHPGRVWKLVSAVVRDDPKTRLSGAIVRVLKKKRKLRHAEATAGVRST